MPVMEAQGRSADNMTVETALRELAHDALTVASPSAYAVCAI